MGTKLREQDLQARRAGDAQAVQMGFDAFVQFAEVVKVVVGPTHGVIVKQDEEAGFFGVLLDD